MAVIFGSSRCQHFSRELAMAIFLESSRRQYFETPVLQMSLRWRDGSASRRQCYRRACDGAMAVLRDASATDELAKSAPSFTCCFSASFVKDAMQNSPACYFSASLAKDAPNSTCCFSESLAKGAMQNSPCERCSARCVFLCQRQFSIASVCSRCATFL